MNKAPGENWLKTKFVNPRDIEGRPQAEMLRYIRELFETFGMTDPRFSGAVIVGSTVKGYGQRNSDIDANVFYCENVSDDYENGWSASFSGNLYTFMRKFIEKREEDGKTTFDITLVHKNQNLSRINLTPETIKDYALIFHLLSYPTIGTKNPDALMPIKEFLNKMRTVVAKASDHQKAELLAKILEWTSPGFEEDFRKHSARGKLNVSQGEYINTRVEMLKQELQRKFGLYIK